MGLFWKLQLLLVLLSHSYFISSLLLWQSPGISCFPFNSVGEEKLKKLFLLVDWKRNPWREWSALEKTNKENNPKNNISLSAKYQSKYSRLILKFTLHMLSYFFSWVKLIYLMAYQLLMDYLIPKFSPFVNTWL